jgi:hypothetical protein
MNNEYQILNYGNQDIPSREGQRVGFPASKAYTVDFIHKNKIKIYLLKASRTCFVPVVCIS